MGFSTVLDKPLKQKRRTERPILTGESIVQELGVVETKTYRFFWITTAELQAKIQELEQEAADGWVIVGDVSRTAVHDALDLYNASVTMHRYMTS
jgi:hypothetical protein